MRSAVLLLAWVMFGAAGCREEPAAWIAPPKEAPPFALSTLAGETHRLEDYRGEPLIVDFWATWCAPCVQQIPVLNRALEEYGPRGIHIVGISVDHEGPEVVSAFADEHGIAYPILLGDESLAQRYGALGFPALFVIDGEGRIDSVHFGVVSWDELVESLDAVE